MVRTTISRTSLTSLVVCYGIMLIGLFWDAWWHVAIGRDSFWIPPHDLMYGAIVAAGIITLTLYKKHPEAHAYLRWMLIGLTITVAAGPFDEWWHDRFGIENLSSPLVVWSPPHLLGLIGGAISMFAYYPLLNRVAPKQVLLRLAHLSFILGLAWFIVHPLDPYGIYQHYFGTLGTALFTLPFLAILIKARHVQPGGSLIVASIFLALYAITWTERPDIDITLAPHILPPLFIYPLSILGAALAIEALWERFPAELVGVATSVAFVALFFLTAQPFLQASFRYPLADVALAFLSAPLAGFVAATITHPKTSR